MPLFHIWTSLFKTNKVKYSNDSSSIDTKCLVTCMHGTSRLQRTGEEIIKQNHEILELEVSVWNTLFNLIVLWLMSVVVISYFSIPEHTVSFYQISYLLRELVLPSLALSFDSLNDSLDEAGFILRSTSGYLTQFGSLRKSPVHLLKPQKNQFRDRFLTQNWSS